MKKYHVAKESLRNFSRDFWSHLVSVDSPQVKSDCLAPDYSQRGITSLKAEWDKSFDKYLDNIGLLSRSCFEFEDMQSSIHLMYEQMTVLKNKLPAFVWDVADKWIKCSRHEAIQWLELVLDDYIEWPTTEYYLNIVGSQFQRASNRNYELLGFIDKKGISDRIARSVVSGGGADHFLCYGLAYKLALLYIDSFLIVVGLATHILPEHLSMIADQKVRRMIDIGADLWLPEYEAPLKYFSAIPQDLFSIYCDSNLKDFELHLLNIHKMYSLIEDAKGETSVANRESSMLRRKIIAVESREAELRKKLQFVSSELELSKGAAANAEIHINKRKEDQHLLDAIRDLNKQIAKSVEDLIKTKAELQAVRQLLSISLGSVSVIDSCNEVNLNNDIDVCDRKIIFVGGHERLHAKLRKHMRGASFIHPDRLNVDPLAFASAECVVFCVSYCSHVLSMAAMQEVRRHKLCFGYTNNTNVDLVLDDVREILSEKWPSKDRSYSLMAS
jgi:signal transduction histidine kinase